MTASSSGTGASLGLDMPETREIAALLAEVMPLLDDTEFVEVPIKFVGVSPHDAAGESQVDEASHEIVSAAAAGVLDVPSEAGEESAAAIVSETTCPACLEFPAQQLPSKQDFAGPAEFADASLLEIKAKNAPDVAEAADMNIVSETPPQLDHPTTSAEAASTKSAISEDNLVEEKTAMPAASGVTASPKQAEQRCTNEPTLIPLGDLRVADYFALVNWRNDPTCARHPYREPPLDEETLAALKSIPFYEARPKPVARANSVTAILSQFSWD